jgi:nitrous oxide reductase
MKGNAMKRLTRRDSLGKSAVTVAAAPTVGSLLVSQAGRAATGGSASIGKTALGSDQLALPSDLPGNAAYLVRLGAPAAK